MATEQLPETPKQVYYKRLNELRTDAGFDAWSKHGDWRVSESGGLGLLSAPQKIAAFDLAAEQESVRQTSGDTIIATSFRMAW